MIRLWEITFKEIRKLSLMVTRKYIKDYKFSESLENGKVKTTAVYVGDYYEFVNADMARRGRMIMLPICIIAWLLFVGVLVPNTTASHLMYVLLPYAFIAIPLGYASSSVFTGFRAEKRMIRSEKEKVWDRLHGISIFGMILSAVSFLGVVISAIAGVRLSGIWDILFAVVCAVLFALFLLLFIFRKVFECKICSGETNNK